VPAIADKIPSYQEFGNYALFENWFESLVTYAENPRLRKEHVTQAQAYIQTHYTSERTVRQWAEFINMVI
jgi:hypothetical protein